MRYNLVCVFLEDDNRQYNGLIDVINPVSYGLRKLGHSVSYSKNSPDKYSRNIFFGLHTNEKSMQAVGKDDIIFNLEQYSPRSAWFSPEYVSLMQEFEAWDYSRKNIINLHEAFGIESRLCRVGYVPELDVISRDFPKDIDVLFYGSLNKRRAGVLSVLSQMKMNVLATDKAFYGAGRDALIARSKVVLNIHYYESAILEVARLGYLWSNGKAVVSEVSDPLDIYGGLDSACAFSSYDSLVETTLLYVRDEKRRKALEKQAQETFRQQPMEKSLEPLVGKSLHSVQFAPCPKCLNVGSGKAMRPDCLNVDIDANWGPDFVYDMSQQIPDGMTVESPRLGRLKLQFGSFAHAVVHDVLEHVPSVVGTMTNIANLLQDGGTVDIIVPYDLSCEAWQDPTHVRAFNEQSWKYYTNWSWYIGWREYTFDVVKMDVVFDKNQKDIAKVRKEALAVPRAVKAMHVVLQKRQTTDEEKLMFDVQHGKFYERGEVLSVG